MNAQQQLLFAGTALRTRTTEKQYWLTPPEFYATLNSEFHFDFDPCPCPLPEGFNGLTRDWGRVNYVNPPFRARDAMGASGPTAFVHKAIHEQASGRTSVIVLPVHSYIDTLLRAGAELRPVGRLPWLDVETLDSCPNPGTIALFVLRGRHEKEGSR